MNRYISFLVLRNLIANDPALTYHWYINIVVDIPEAHRKGLKR